MRSDRDTRHDVETDLRFDPEIDVIDLQASAKVSLSG